MAEEDPVPAAPQYNSQATASLVVGIVALVCCNGIISPIAWFLGSRELNRTKAGNVIDPNEGIAKAGMILGIVGTVLMIVGILVLGGFLFLGILSEIGNF